MARVTRILTTVLLVLPVALVCLYYLFFICAVPERWPYFTPVIDGASVDDPGRHSFLPRANLSPRATLAVTPNLSLRTRLGCYPLGADGAQSCSFQVRFFDRSGADIAFSDKPVTVLGADGADLIDRDFLALVAGRLPGGAGEEIRDGKVYLTYGESLSLMLKRAILPDRLTVRMPDLIVDGKPVALPSIAFVRHDNLTCRGLFANF